MARGKRETFLLNPHSKRDNLIIDFLDNQFNRSETIRDIIYQYVINNHNENRKSLPYHESNRIGVANDNGNDDYNNDGNNHYNTYGNNRYNTNNHYNNDGNDYYNNNDNTNNHYNDCGNKDTNNHDNGFKIDLSAVDDEFIDIKTNDKEINADKEAINYLNNWR